MAVSVPRTFQPGDMVTRNPTLKAIVGVRPTVEAIESLKAYGRARGVAVKIVEIE